MTDLLKLCDNDYLLLGGLPPQSPAASRRALRGVEVAIQEEARSWIGTPFRHQGRIKGVGCDCLGLLIGVAQALALKDKQGLPLALLDSRAYGHFPDEMALRKGLENALHPEQEMGAGCIVLMRIDCRAQHLGILGSLEFGVLSLIHAYAPQRKVVEHRLSKEWREKIVAGFRSCN